jgi:hypothetical protein
MTLKKTAGLLAVLVAALMVMVPAAQAKKPAAGYEQFAGCLSPEEFPGSEVCARAVIKSGHFQMGTKDVPIEKPMELRGSILPGDILGANSEGGLTPVKQKVPGGIVGLTGLTWLLEFFGSEALTLYAVTELAGIPKFTTALNLPIKVHLIHSVLGNNCYVGSVANPIKLALITGTTSPPAPNKPITGKSPEFSFDFEKEIIHQKNGTFVDNSFSAPGATGCTLTLFGFIPISINGLVNSQSGLPAAAGTNETVQNFDQEIVSVEKVYP